MACSLVLDHIHGTTQTAPVNRPAQSIRCVPTSAETRDGAVDAEESGGTFNQEDNTMTNPSAFESQHTAGTSTQWLASLNEAIQAGNDPGLWNLLAQHSDPVEAHHKLATQIARLAYLIGSRPRFSEMFQVPVIDAPGGRVIDDAAAWKHASFCIGEALDGWLPSRVRKTVFSGIRPYDWIGTWRPAILRTHLHSTIPGWAVRETSFLTETIHLPEQAPKLGFICMVLTSERGWPPLPVADSLRDNRFKSVVGMALQPAARVDCPVVLAPDRMQYAVADGLCLWLHMLHQAVPITGWMVMPIATNPDVVKITLALECDSVRFTQFTVRKHQIGLEGVEGVLTMLQALAPTMDVPMDMPAAKKQTQTLSLT
jgi:hypothetical protein